MRPHSSLFSFPPSLAGILKTRWISHSPARKILVLCYRVAVGVALHLDPKFVSRQMLPPTPQAMRYVARGGQHKVRATH